MTAEAQPKHASLVEALAAAQAEFPAIEKSKTAQVRSEKGNYSYSYADLASILAAVRPVLAAHGIATVQRIEAREGGMMLLTDLLFGAERLSSEMPLPAEMRNPQAFGSYLTYAKRYTLGALVGVAAEEDDDDGASARDAAAAGSSKQKATATPRPEKRPAPEPEPRPTSSAAATATPPEDDRGEPAYKLEGVPRRAAEWIDSADKESRRREGRALAHWWDAYKDTRHAIYQRHADLRPMLKALSDDIRGRALRATEADATKTG